LICLTPSANVWVRSLASGTDTILLLVVNDNYFNDIAGCHSTDVHGDGHAAVLMTTLSAFQSR
jgi:hypothetical protein